MKNFTFLAFTLFFLSVGFTSTAQIKSLAVGSNQSGTYNRCGTWEAIQKNLQSNPQFRAQYEQGLRDYDRSVEAMKNGRLSGALRTSALPDSVVIPVVVHIVLPNPNIITDADVQYFLNRLNLDFSGRNPDSANASLFYGVRGHSKLRFTLAKRTSANAYTTGIERKVGAVVITEDTYQEIKHTSDGGLDPWDVTKYYNLWVGVGDAGLLGIAPNIGPGGQTETTASTIGIDGVCIDYTVFANNTCYTDPSFNLGRTAVHEIGHNFGLYHINGDVACGNDFTQIFGPCQLPASLLAASDDTPLQSSLTGGCPSGAVTSGCAGSPNPPGKMYQNYMDYTNDPCLTMFTKGQGNRMEYVLEFCRAGYLTTQGGVLPGGVIAWDAAPGASVNPGGFELSGCATIISYTDALSCAGNIAPKFLVTNRGLNTITSLTVGYRYDNGAAVSQSVTVNLASGVSTVVSLPSLAVAVGNHTFKFFTAAPNGNADQVPANDTLTQAFRVMAPAVPPVVEGFETPPPFTNFAIDDKSSDGLTWVRTTPGRNGSAGKLSFDNYSNEAVYNTFDDLRSTSITVNPAGNYSLSFDIAHKYFNQAGFQDTLSVYISGNCGQTFTRVFQKFGAALAGTAGSLNASAYTTPAAADWHTETVSLTGSSISSGQIVVVFRNSSRYGQNIHLDNISILSAGGRDLRLVSINPPAATTCSPNVVPSVTIANDGTETVTSFKVGYRLNTGANTITTFTQSIAPGATATVSLPAGAAISGNNTITAFTADPVSVSGAGDGKTSNDTLSKTFVIPSLVSPPVVEGFETAFPPAGWAINNPNNNVTWVRKAPGRASAFSAFFDNYTNNVIGQIDEMRLPIANIGGADSLIISFDLAHKQYADPGGVANDRLTVLTSADCGSTYTPVYNKAGATLATAGTSDANYTTPAAADWRRETISLGGTAISSGSIGVAFRNTNDYGNNIFIDNINIAALYKRDLQLISINSPTTLICSNSVTPAVTVRNIGLETVTAFKVSYSINGGTALTQNITGVSMARNAEMNVTLPAGTLATPGAYNLRVYSWDPVTTSGTGDQNKSNDTLTRTVYVPGATTAPLAETFVSTSFPPTNWSIINGDGNITWSRNSVGSTNAGSAYVNTYNYPSLGQRDDLVTPSISFNTSDTVRLQFDLAAVTYSYPGITNTPIDTLEVLVTKDCGNTFTSVYKKWGNELQTIDDPNFPQTTEFIPTAANQWRRETVDLTAFANQSPLLVMFRVTNNFENNIFIDNVDFFTSNVPSLLKQQGYLIYPTAFRNSFNVRHYQTPSTLKYINVFNSVGQLVWAKQYSGNANTEMSIDLTGKAAGVYVVEVGYTDVNRNVVQKITKY